MAAESLNTQYPETFSAELIQHCISGFVPPQVFRDAAPSATTKAEQQARRFVRVHPRFVSTVVRREGLAAEKVTTRLRHLVADSFHIRPDDVESVSWLPCYAFSVDKSLPLHANVLHQDGFLIGMDAASMAAVVSLQPQLGDCCLDMCCAPAMKLSLIADAVTPSCAASSDSSRGEGAGSGGGGGIAVGVDVSVDRLFVARSIVQRHCKVWEAGQSACAVALFAADGRHFSLDGAAKCLDEREDAPVDAKGVTTWESRALKRGRPSVAKRARAGTQTHPTSAAQVDEPCNSTTRVVYASACARSVLRVQSAATCTSGMGGGTMQFDRVLVDAECSHDGSLSHINFTAPPSKEVGEKHETSGADKTNYKGIHNVHRMARMNLHSDPKDSAPQTTSAPLSADVSVRWRSSWLEGAFLLQSPLAQLQLALLCRGYEVLKLGGTLVYSTCSFSFLQNEYILLCFLEMVNGGDGSTTRASVHPAFKFPPEASAEGVGKTQVFLRPVSPEALQRRLNHRFNDYRIVQRGLHAVSAQPDKTSTLMEEARKGLLGSRFWPSEFNTSFQYIAKIRKEAL